MPFDCFNIIYQYGSCFDTTASAPSICFQKSIGSVHSTDSTMRSGFIEIVHFPSQFDSNITLSYAVLQKYYVCRFGLICNVLETHWSGPQIFRCSGLVLSRDHVRYTSTVVHGLK